MMGHNYVSGCWALLVFAAMGCSVQSGTDAGGGSTSGNGDSEASLGLEPSSEAVASQSSAVLSACPITYTTFELAGTTTGGPTYPGNICWPTRYDRFSSGSSPNLVAQDDASGHWVFDGFGQIMCVPKCVFWTNEASSATERTLSPKFVSSKTASLPSESIIFNDTAMWQNDAMPIITGIVHTPNSMGWFDGVFIRKDPGVNGVSYLESWVDPDLKSLLPLKYVTETTTAIGYSLFVGVAHTGHVVKQQSFVFSSAATTDPSNELLPANQNLCTITQLMFPRASNSFAAKLSIVNGVWRFNPGPNIGGTPPNGFFEWGAIVTCYAFNQSP